MLLQPRPVLAEIGADRANEQRRAIEHAHREGDVARDAAAADLQIVDEEAQRDMVELVGQQHIGEPSGKAHEVVGRDGRGHGDRHEAGPLQR
ncbi:Uncharacterised protein [Mycobacteroides abscessus subsp. abscessus]|nr:Uncharacterised protein [Mycobacteroides abscessus subsp. abscessus]